MPPRRQIATKNECVCTWVIVVLSTAIALLHASTAAGLWLDGAKLEIFHWGPIVSTSLVAV